MARTHRILDRVIFYGLLITVVITAIPYGSVQPWWIAVFECAIFLLAICAVVDLMITGDRLPARVSVALPLVALCLFLVFQSLPLFASGNPVLPDLRLSISADPYATQMLAIKLFALILVGVLVLRYANTEARLRTLVYVVIGIGVASAVFGILRRGSGGPNWFFPLPNPEKGFAQFINRNHFGFLMVMSLGLALGLAIRAARGHKKWLLFLPIAALLWGSLVIANSRGAIFASLCQLILLVLLMNPFRRSGSESEGSWKLFRNLAGGVALKVVLIVALIVVFAYGVSWVGGESVVTNLELSGYSFSEAGSQGHRENISRKDIWTATWQLIKERPILGAGFGGYWIAITKYHDAAGRYSPQEAHNDYLELLASGGLIGLAIVSWFGVVFVRSMRNVLKSERGFVRHASLGAIVAMFGVLIHSFVDFGLHITINAFIFAILLAIPLAGDQLRGARSSGLQKAQS